MIAIVGVTPLPMPTNTTDIRSVLGRFVPLHSTLGLGGQALEIVARPPNLVVLLTHCGQLIPRQKISKFDATSCQILRLKCTKVDFRWDSAPDPLGEFTALPQTPWLF